jgi:DNA-binding MarR family transcriptional regulator
MSLGNPATVDELLNYRLASLLATSSAMTTRLCEGRYGITRREWRLIALLADYGAMSPSALATQADLKRAVVSRLITDLTGKRLVIKASQPGDNRRAILELSQQGLQLHAELFPQSVQFTKRVLSVLTPAQLAAFDEALTLIASHADEVVRSYPIEAKADRRHGGSRRSKKMVDDDAPVW